MSVNSALPKENSFVRNRARLFDGRSDEGGTDRQAPSYVTLSCSVNGYSGYTCYDSKARQDIRSRDSSRDRTPLCVSRSRDPSPRKAGTCTRLSSGFLVSSPNGVTTPPSRMLSNRSKSVDRNILKQNFLNGCVETNSSKPATNWHKSSDNLHQPPSLHTLNKDPVPERGRVRYRATTAPAPDSKNENKSLIQQRIERLYGPGALARSFFTPKTPQKADIESNNNKEDLSVTDFQRSSTGTPPVFRHLNPEFRQQLISPKNSSVQKQIASPSVPITPPLTENLPGNLFLKILDEEKKKLEFRIRAAEENLSHSNVSSSEEFMGKIHAAVGKCRLLMAQKFEQFAGLCRKNLHQSPEEPFPTTGDDLAGFWDMVTIQVEHIYTLFNEIDDLRQNGWKEVEVKVENNNTAASRVKRPPTKSSRSSTTSSARSAKAQEAAKAREEARKKMMEEKRRLMKEKKIANDENNPSWIIEDKGPNGDMANKPELSEDLQV